jgi:hypothetical protein
MSKFAALLLLPLCLAACQECPTESDLAAFKVGDHVTVKWSGERGQVVNVEHGSHLFCNAVDVRFHGTYLSASVLFRPEELSK